MPKQRTITVLTIAVLALSGCGEAYPTEAKQYTAAAGEVLIARKVCADAPDCRRKEMLFWEGGNPWIPSLKMAFVKLYDTQDEALVEAVVSKLHELRTKNGMPPVRLIVYSSKHSQAKIKFREVSIK